MADKGFDIKDILEPIGCEITIPTFLASKGQFSKEELLHGKKIHDVPVHLERAIRMVKEFHYFDNVVHLTVAGSVNQIWTASCLIANLQGPLF